MVEVPAKLELLDVIGQGAHGVVWRAEDPVTGLSYACKAVSANPQDSGVSCTALREISLLKRCSGPGLVRLHTVFQALDPGGAIASGDARRGTSVDTATGESRPPPADDPVARDAPSSPGLASRSPSLDPFTEAPALPPGSDTLVMVFEWLDRDLRAALGRLDPQRLLQPSRAAGPIPPWTAKHVLREILRGLANLHRHGIAHRDIRPENVLVSNDLREVRLADLGLARYVGASKKRVTPGMVTLWYRPPEVLAGSATYGVGVDMWSVGCVMFELFERRPLFPARSETAMLISVCETLGTPDASKWGEGTPFADGRARLPKHPRKELSQWAAEVEKAGPAASRLLLAFLDPDPEKRIDVSSALEHPFFSEEGELFF